MRAGVLADQVGQLEAELTKVAEGMLVEASVSVEPAGGCMWRRSSWLIEAGSRR